MATQYATQIETSASDATRYLILLALLALVGTQWIIDSADWLAIAIGMLLLTLSIWHTVIHVRGLWLVLALKYRMCPSCGYQLHRNAGRGQQTCPECGEQYSLRARRRLWQSRYAVVLGWWTVRWLIHRHAISRRGT